MGTSQLADGAVTDAKVATGISFSKLAGAPTSLPPNGAAGGSLAGTYPGPTIASSAIGTAQLANGAVTAGKISAAGSSSGQVLTSTGSAAAWQNPAGLTLPYSGGANTSSPAFLITNSAGNGVAAEGDAPGGNGIVGRNSASGYAAVFGQNDVGYGVYGTSASGGFAGVLGVNTNGAGVQGVGNIGVSGTSNAANGVAVKADAPNGNAVVGTSTAINYAAVYGGNSKGYGLYGVGAIGVFGTSDSATGAAVYGRDDNAYGVEAIGGPAILGYSTTGVGVAATSTGSYAGYFNGTGYFSGMLTKAGGGFKIDHPLDPADKYLYHSFVESPEMMNIYNGDVVTDDDGLAVVQLPDWFEALNRDFRYQLKSRRTTATAPYLAACAGSLAVIPS